jgi:hypothetical protein
MTSFTVEPLARAQIRTVYPLIREVLPELTLAAWVRFATGLTGVRRNTRAGIIVARRASREFPSGLFCYRVQRDPARGKILVAEHFVAVDPLHPGDVLSALTGELDALGRRLGCDAVRGIVHRPEEQGGLLLAGLAAEGSLLGKSLGEKRPPMIDGG